MATGEPRLCLKGRVDILSSSQVLSGWDESQVLPDALIFKEELMIHIS